MDYQAKSAAMVLI